jgi:hypothetical protein
MPIVDPVTTYNSWLLPPAPSGTVNSLRGILDIDEDKDGAMGVSEFNEAWKNSLAAVEAFGVISDRAAMVNAILEDPTRSQCAAATAYSRKTTKEPPNVRNNHNRDASYFMPKAVKFADPADDGMEIDFQHEQSQSWRKIADAASKKVWLLDKLSANPSEIIWLLLQAPVTLQLQQALANMPDVKKRLLRPTSADEAADLLQANSTAAQASLEDGNPRCNALQVSPLAAALPDSNGLLTDREWQQGNAFMCGINANIPEYVEVEASNGIITQCGSYFEGPGRFGSKAQPLMPREPGYHVSRLAPGEDDDQPTFGTSEYDRDHGIEHLRRNCPIAYIQVFDARLSALLDSGAELNTMRLRTAMTAGLAVTSMPEEMSRARLQTANGGTEAFAGMAWRVPVQIGDFTIKANFFITRALSHPVILGNPFLADTSAKFEYSQDGRMYCNVTADNGTITRFVAAQDTKANLRRIFSVSMDQGKGQGI